MAAIPPTATQEIINRIYAAIAEEKQDTELYLGRLGSSSIGQECPRAVWLSWRAYAKADFGGRMLRLFETGHLQEARIVADLRRAGFKVFDFDEHGNQFQYVDSTGHFISKVDGVIKGVPGSSEKPHILEIKTHNKNSFAGVVKHGVQKSKPTHYAQVQSSMSLSGIDRALYVALCKDDEQFYVERIKEDKTEQNLISRRIVSLVNATLRPARINEDIESFACKYCDMKEVCFDKVAPLRTCRSCRNAVPAPEGVWHCTRFGTDLDKDAQRAACDEYDKL